MGRLCLLAAALLGVTAISLSQAGAADLGAACCADLEERIAELEAVSARKGNKKVSVTVSGLVTWPIMVWDDGEVSDAYIVSNEVRRSRFRFSGLGQITADLSAGFALEIGPNPSPTAPMDQFSYVASSGEQELRYAYWFAKSATYGQLSLGQQSQASDTITEISLANTGVVVTPGLPVLLGYVTRGWFMRRDDGVLTGQRFGDLLFRGRTDIVGEGHRWHVLRYDSPSFGGFTLSGSWGENDAEDIALRYTGDWGRLSFAAGLAFTRWRQLDEKNNGGCARTDASMRTDCWQTAGSASVMDKQTGLFLNVAAGYGKDHRVGDIYRNAPGLDDDDTFFYALAGIERQWLDIGKTTIFAHVWHRDLGAGIFFSGAPIDARPLGAAAFVSAADVTLYGLSVVQTLGEGIDVYASLNRTETEVETSPTGGRPDSVKTGIMPFDFLIAGMAVRF